MKKKSIKPLATRPNNVRDPAGSFLCDVYHDFLQALKNGVMYLILAPHDNEQYDLLQRVKETEQLDDLPIYMYDLQFSVLLLVETCFGWCIQKPV